jgi:hypothetical protein
MVAGSSLGREEVYYFSFPFWFSSVPWGVFQNNISTTPRPPPSKSSNHPTIRRPVVRYWQRLAYRSNVPRYIAQSRCIINYAWSHSCGVDSSSVSSRNPTPFMETDSSLTSSQEPPLVSILSQMNLDHTLAPYSFKSIFNIILPFTPGHFTTVLSVIGHWT